MSLEDAAAYSPVHIHFAARHVESEHLAAGAFGPATGPSSLS